VPSVAENVEKILTELDPSQGVEQEYMSKYNPAYCWKFFRSISFTDLSKFGVVQPDEKKEVKQP
jgi:hypothetical protein